jgi:hypothetical protein
MKLRVLIATGLAALMAGTLVAIPGSAHGRRVSQTVALSWHAQSGQTGPVGERAKATLVRQPDGVRYRIDTHGLVPGHAYTVWFVLVNDPAACDAAPCAPPQIIGDPAVDGQVTWGKEGRIARHNGTARFNARVAAGPLLDGWLQVQGLDDPMGAEIHLVLNDHGPVIDELKREMLRTYRAGCSDASPFPAFFPPAALADGTPGPNTCLLWQSAVFPPPSSS